jgi:hypothetical protein
MRARIVAEAASDLEPEVRFTPAWNTWLLRDLVRRGHLTELAEAEALTTHPGDPAPVASQGWKAFRDWADRQERRRRARRVA